MVGYNEMLRRIKPEKIIYYNTPFSEMQGNIVFIAYECSSWRHMNYKRSLVKNLLPAKCLTSAPAALCLTLPEMDTPRKWPSRQWPTLKRSGTSDARFMRGTKGIVGHSAGDFPSRTDSAGQDAGAHTGTGRNCAVCFEYGHNFSHL